MGLIQELVDLVGKLNFVAIVHEYEQGLYFRKGIVIERRVRGMKPAEIEEIRAEERAARKSIGGFGLVPGRRRSKLPPGFRTTRSGRLIHSRRFSKVLRPGIYFHLPIIEHVVTDYRQERVLNLGYESVLTLDEEPAGKAVIISCNLRYELMDLYRAYTAVYDYEESLRGHTLSILAMKSLGRKYEEWKQPATISSIEKDVVDELRKIVTEKWGLKIHQVYITDVTDARIYKFAGSEHMAALPVPVPPAS